MIAPPKRLLYAGGAFLLLAGLAAVVSGERSAREPFYGPHQAGIGTRTQRFAFVTAFDLTTERREDLRDLFVAWTAAAAAMAEGEPWETAAPAALPPSDTGETIGYKPARLTVTFGAGPSLFDGRFGLAALRPPALSHLPAFPGDDLESDMSDGDLVVQVCADDYQTAFHAIHNLTRIAKGVAVPRWVQDGFQSGLEVNTSGPPRNLQGFIDGTENVDPKSADMDRVVWVDGGPEWMRGGSYLVVRRIRMFVETWDRSSLSDQERTIGREKHGGAELPSMDADSHVRLARGDGSQKIFRRPYNYVAGLDGRTGQWDAGLIFLAWMKDPAAQFVPMQRRLSANDALNEYIRTVGSAVFAVFPGVEEGDYVGSALFPTPSLAQRIEGLQARIGALYPFLRRGDWERLRSDAADWNRSWRAERKNAGKRAAAIDGLGDDWLSALSREEPDADEVRRAQGALIAALMDWREAAVPKTAVSFEALKESADRAAKAAAAADGEGARRAFGEFQREWTKKEGAVRSLYPEAYAELELGIGAAQRALRAAPYGGTAVAALETLGRRLAALRGQKRFGAIDAAMVLFREGLEALLVLAALLAFLRKTDQASRKAWVWSGAATGLAASVAVAAVVSAAMDAWLSTAPELVEGLTGIAAVVLMLTVGAWLHGKAVTKTWNGWIKERMARAVNNPWALALLAFLSVLREGAETIVFLWGMAGEMSLSSLLLGAAASLAVLSVLGVLMIGFSRRLPLRWFFPAATAMIYFLAVKILGQSLASLQVAGWIGGTSIGFGGPVGWLGFTPTWETALPQLSLAAVLVTLIVISLRKNRAGGEGSNSGTRSKREKVTAPAAADR